jgi:hypothetical protein
VAEAERPVVGGGLAGEDAQQAGLARPVQAEDEEPFAAGHVEGDVLEHGRAAVALGQPVDLERDPARVGRRRETHVDGAVAGGDIDAGRLDAGDPLLHAVGHRGLCRLGAEAVDERLQPGDLLGVGGRLLGQALLVLGPGRSVLAVGALVLGDRPRGVLTRALEVDDPGDGLVEQFEVVADDEQRAPIGAEELHEPRLGVGVEVVRGFVEQQDVAAGIEDAGQLDPPPLTAREDADRQVHAIGAEPEPVGDGAHLGVGRVATLVAKGVLGPAEPGHVGVARVLFHLGPQLLDAHHGLVEPPARQDVLHRGAPVEDAGDPRVLRQVAEGARTQHAARHRGRSAAQHPQQARLAGAVAADQAHLVAGADGEGGARHDQAPPDLHSEPVDGKHGRPGCQVSRRFTLV